MVFFVDVDHEEKAAMPIFWFSFLTALVSTSRTTSGKMVPAVSPVSQSLSMKRFLVELYIFISISLTALL